MKAIVVADGDVAAADAPLPGRAGGPHLVVAADGGAHKALLLGLLPDVVVGDMDSLAPESLAELERRGVQIQRHPASKDASDTELAVQEALRRGADRLLILGALGGPRFEHTLANVLLLTLPELADRQVELLHGPVTVRVLGVGGAGTLAISGRPGDLVSLLPLSEEVHGVTTDGLAYPLAGETLRQGPARGISNVLVGTAASVSTEAGRLAVVHSRITESGDE